MTGWELRIWRKSMLWSREKAAREFGVTQRTWHAWENAEQVDVSKRLVRTVLIFTESSDQLSRATDRVPGLPASPGYVQ